MSEFAVKWGQLSADPDAVRAVGKSLYEKKGKVSSVCSKLCSCLDSGSYAGIRQRLKAVMEQMDDLSLLSGQCADRLEEIARRYRDAEAAVCGNAGSEFTGKDGQAGTGEKEEEMDLSDFLKLIWKLVGKAGVIGKLVSIVGALWTGERDGKGWASAVKDLLEMIGDCAKEAGSGAEADWMKALFGDWAKGGAVESLKKAGYKTATKGDLFKSSFSKFFDEFDLSKATSVGEKVKVVTKWREVILSAVGNYFSNLKEFGGEKTARFWAETATETAVDIAVDTLARVGVAALLGVSVPAAAGVAVVWAADWICKNITSAVIGEEKGLTETISDIILDFGEKIIHALGGDAVQSGAGWRPAWQTG